MNDDLDFDFELSSPVPVTTFMTLDFEASMVHVKDGQAATVQFQGKGSDASPARAAVFAEVDTSGRAVGLRFRFMSNRNGVSVNGKKIEDSRYHELREKDCLQFGDSSREYVLLNAGSGK